MKHILTLFAMAIATLFLSSCSKVVYYEYAPEAVHMITDTVTTERGGEYAAAALNLRNQLNLQRKRQSSSMGLDRPYYSETGTFYFHNKGEWAMTVDIKPIQSSGAIMTISRPDQADVTFTCYGGKSPAILTYPSNYSGGSWENLFLQMSQLQQAYEKQPYAYEMPPFE